MKILIILFSIFCFSCKSQSISKEIDLQKQIPQDLIIDKVEKLNFDNDKELETIITASDDTYSQLYEFWFKKGKLLRKTEHPWVSVNYKWIIDIDHDDLHEIIRVQGYEDGINYGIYDIVDNNNKLLLFAYNHQDLNYFLPVFELQIFDKSNKIVDKLIVAGRREYECGWDKHFKIDINKTPLISNLEYCFDIEEGIEIFGNEVDLKYQITSLSFQKIN